MSKKFRIWYCTGIACSSAYTPQKENPQTIQYTTIWNAQLALHPVYRVRKFPERGKNTFTSEMLPRTGSTGGKSRYKHIITKSLWLEGYKSPSPTHLLRAYFHISFCQKHWVSCNWAFTFFPDLKQEIERLLLLASDFPPLCTTGCTFQSQWHTVPSPLPDIYNF